MASSAATSWTVLETLEKRFPSYPQFEKAVVPSKTQFEEGDVVLIAEPKANRGEWPLGRVMEVY